MPHRIQLTLPDDVYEKLKRYKEKTGITGDSPAARALIIQKLNELTLE